MAKTTVQLVEYTCDGCEKVVHMNEGDVRPPGYHGTVQLVDDRGRGDKEVDWYAHHSRCVRTAILDVTAQEAARDAH
jgi:hypothetical protein